MSREIEVKKIIKAAEDMINKILGRAVSLELHFRDETKERSNLKSKLLNLVCEEFKVSLQEIQTSRRFRNVSDARKAYTWIAYNYLNESQYRTSITLRTAHSGGHYLLRKANDLLSINDPIKGKIENILRKIKVYHNDKIERYERAGA